MAIRFAGSAIDWRKGFTPYPTPLLRARLLTTDETAIYLWFLSMDDDFSISMTYLQNAFPDLSKMRAQRAMRGLMEHGLVDRVAKMNDGRMNGYDYYVNGPQDLMRRIDTESSNK